MRGLRFGMAGVYTALALLGAFWLFYVNRASVRVQFASGQAAIELGARPLSITITARILLIFGVLVIPFSFFSPFPGIFFAVPLKRGVSSRLFYLAFGAAEIGIGMGLLRLNPLKLT